MTAHHHLFDADAAARTIERDGYVVLADFLAAQALDEVRSALAPFLGARLGRNDFEGFATERVYTLVARGEIFERLAADPRVLAVLDRLLLPGYLLSASQAICIRPGETPQGVHADDGFYRLPRPRPAVSVSVIAAVDPFTKENGATEIIAGSHLWSDAEVSALAPDRARRLLRPVELPAGGAILFLGTLLHQGGANQSAASRLAFTNQYCQPWARTQENFFLGVPRAMARAMPARLQRLLGYDIWPPFMGHVTASHPAKSLEPDWIAPVLAQGGVAPTRSTDGGAPKETL